MSSAEADQARKHNLLQRLNSLSPGARQAILVAALEQKSMRACTQESQHLVQYNRLNGSVK